MRKSSFWLGVVLLFPTLCSAATIQWTGAVDGNWNTSTVNWETVPGAVPTAYTEGDTVLFNDSATGTTTITVQGGGVSPASITFSNAAKNYSFSGGAIGGGGGITLNGTGTVTLSTAANSYAGATLVNAGKLVVASADALGDVGGAGTTTVSSGATLALQGGLAYSAAECVFLAGAGLGGVGALENLSGNNSFGGVITLTADATLGSSNGGDKLTLTRSLSGNFLKTFLCTGQIEDSGVISGSGGIAKTGAGTLIFSGTNANTYTGTLTVNSGTLELRKGSGLLSVTGDLTLGDGAGGANSDVVRAFSDNQISSTSNLVLANSGWLDLNGFSAPVNSLTLNGASVSTGLGTLTLKNAGILTVSGSGTTSTLAGIVAVTYPFNHTLTVDDNVTLDLTALVTASTFTKNGNGTLRFLGGANNALSSLNLTAGTVLLNKTPGNRAATNFTVGNNTGVAGAELLRLLAADQIDDNGSVTVTSSGLFDLNGFSETIRGLTVGSGTLSGGQVSTGAGTLTLSGSGGVTQTVNGDGSFGASITGTLALGSANRTFTLNEGTAAEDLTVSAVLQGSGGLTVTGSGRLTIGSVATLSGALTVNGGTLGLKDAGTLLNATSFILNGGTLALDNSGTNLPDRLADGSPIAMSGGALALLGKDGLSSAETVGAITLSANTSTLTNTPGAGGSAILTAERLTPVEGARLDCTGTLGTAVNQIRFTLSPSLSNGILPYGLVNGADFATYTAFGLAAFSNYYTGLIDNAAATDNVKVTADDQVTIPNKVINALLISGNNVDVTGLGGVKLTLASGTLTVSGNVTTVSVPQLSLGVGEGLISVGAGDVTVSSVVSGAKLVKSGTGTLVLGAANTYSGETWIEQGILVVTADAALGVATAGTTVYPGATLAIQGAINYPTAEPVLLAGGTFTSLSGNNTFGGPLTLSAASSITASADTLTLSNAINGATFLPTFICDGNVTVSGAIGGSGGLTKNGAGTLLLTTANSFVGTVTVGSGILQTGTLGALPDFNPLVLGAGATLDLNGNNETVGALSLTGASVTTGGGVLTLTGDLATIASATSSTISGNLSLGETGRTFNVANGAAADDLVVSAILSGAAGAGFTKVGSGLLALSGTGANTYSGTTTVTDGTLEIRKDGALGTAAAGTTVASGKTLAISGGVVYTLAEAVTLNGGTFNSLNGTNAFPGAFTLGAASTVTVPAGALTLSGDLSAGTFTPTFQGAAGTLTMQGPLSGTGGVTKSEAGTLILTHTGNSYSGNTNLNAGTLRLGAAGVIPNASVVSWGGNATLDLNGFDEEVAGLSNSTTTTSRVVVFGNGAANTLTLNLSADFTYNGAFNSTDASDKVLKSGSAKQTLGGDSTGYAGLFDLQAGVLRVAGNGATVLGNTGGNTTVASGAQLQIGIGSCLEPVSIAGTGVGGSGAILGDALTFSGPITLNGPATIGCTNSTFTVGGALGLGTHALTLSVPFAFTISGVISGSGSILKTGSARLNLSANNSATYTGAVTVSAGYLQILTNAGALGSTGVGEGTTVADGATLEINVAGSSEPVSLQGTGMGGVGALFGQSNVTFSGPLTLNGDTLIGSNANPFTVAGSISLGANALTLYVNAGTTTLVASGAITGSGTVYKTGGNQATLSGNSAATFTGPVQVSAGTLLVSNSGALGGAASGTTIASGTSLVLQIGVTLPEPLTLNGGTLSNSGAGTATFSGGIAIGSDSIFNPVGFGSIVAVTTLPLTGSGAITKTGSGNLVLGVDSPAFGGAVLVQSSTLRIDTAAALGPASPGTTVDGGTLQINVTGASEEVTLTGSGIITGSVIGATFSGPLTLTGPGGVSATVNPFTISGNIDLGSYNLLPSMGSVGTVILSGIISGTGGIVRTTNGTLTLSGANTFTGAVSISGAGNTNLANSNVYTGPTVVNGGTLTLKDSGTALNTDITVNTGGTFVIDNSTAGSTSYNSDRFGNGKTLTLAGGTFQYKGRDNTACTETIDAVTVNSGLSTFTLTPGSGTGTAVLTGAALNPNGGQVAFTGTFGSASNQILFTANPPLTGGILPYATATVGASSAYATYGANGIAIATDVTGPAGGVIDNAATGDNVRLTSDDTMTKNRTTALNGPLTSLVLNADGVDILAGAAYTLELTGATVTSKGTCSTASNVTLDFVANRGIIFVASTETLTISGPLAGSGGIEKTGAGTLILSGACSYTGSTLVTSGTLQLGASNVLPSGTAVTVSSGAILNLNDKDQTVASLTGLGTLKLGNVSTNTFTLGDAGTTTFSGLIDGTSNPADTVVKTGTGKVTLTGANTYTGIITVSQGVLNAQNGTALGTSVKTTVQSGATLEIQGGITTSEILELSGTGVSGGGALRNISGNNICSGAVTLLGNTTVAVDGALETLTLSGIVGDGVSSFGISKTGSGYLVLSNVNTYDGLTTVSAGILTLANTNSLGTTGIGTVVDAGATLEINQNNSAEPVTLNGTGVGGSGALRKYNDGNNRTFSGPLTLGSNALIGSPTSAITLTLNGGMATAGFDATFDGAGNFTLSTVAITGTGGLVKTGTGTLVLSANNSFSGACAINQGLVQISGNANALGTAAGATTVASGATLEVQITGSAEPLTLNGTGVSGIGALKNSANLTFAGAITLGSATTINSVASTFTLSNTVDNGGFLLTLGGAANMALSNVISGAGGLQKADAGTVTLSGANTYAGATTLASGTLTAGANSALGSAAGGTTVASGATLGFSGGITYLPYELVTISGTGAGGAGAINNSSGSNSFAGAITLAADATINAGSSALTLSGALDNGGFLLTVTGSNTVSVTGVVSGGGGLTKSGTGTLNLYSQNSYSGPTTVAAGTLAAYSDYALGSGAGAITLPSGATLSFENTLYTPAPLLNLNGGTLKGASGYVSFSGNIVQGADSTIQNAGASPITLGGTIDLGSFTLTLNQSAGQVLNLNGVISGTGNIFKKSNGTLNLNAANTFSGTFTTDGGNGGGTFPALNNALGTAAGGTSLISGASLVLTNGIQYTTAEPLSIGGSGVNGNGVLRTSDGNCRFDGPLTLVADATVSCTAGANPLTLGGTVDTAGYVLTLGNPNSGNGAFLFAGNLIGSGQLVKRCNGAVTLNGTNTLSGPTEISGGTLYVNGSHASSPIATRYNASFGTSSMTLAGTGTVGTVSLAALGILAPGSAADPDGILQTGAVTLSTGSTLAVDLNGTGVGLSDKLNVTGNAVLNSPTLQVTVGGGYVPAVGDAFTVLQCSGALSGTFVGLADLGLFSSGGAWFQVDYTANAVVLTCVRQNTTSTLASSANPSAFGAGVTITATVAGVSAGAAVPSGSVTFTVDGTTLGTVALDGSGQAQLTMSWLQPAVHTVSAAYGGSSQCYGSTSAILLQNVGPSEVALGATATTINAGDPLTFTATVSGLPSGTPGGTVTFKDGGVSLGSSALAGGVATLLTSALPTGTRSITAVYGGASAFQAGTSAILYVTVNSGAVDHYSITTTTPQTAGVGWFETLTARDINNNIVTGASSAVTLSSDTGNAVFYTSASYAAVTATTNLYQGSARIFVKDATAETIKLKATVLGIDVETGNIVVGATGTGAIDHYHIVAASPQIAGQGFTATLTAHDASHNVVSNDHHTEVYLASTGSAKFYADGTHAVQVASVRLSAGTATLYLKDTVAEGIALSAIDWNNKATASSAVVIVQAGGIARYHLTAHSPQVANTGWAEIVYAQDALGNVVSGDSSTVVTLTRIGSLDFYTNQACTTLLSPAQVTLSGGTATVFLKDTVAETVTFTATDGGGKTGTSAGIVVGAGGNLAPTVTAGPSAAPNPANTGQSVNFSVTANEPDGDPLSYTWNFGDLASATGAAPSHAYAATGTYTASVTIEDGRGGSTSRVIPVTVQSSNSAPVITSGGGGATASVNLQENGTAVLTVTATDADGQTLGYSISGGADAAKFSLESGSGALAFLSAPNFESPTDANANNVYEVTVQVSDGAGGTDAQALSVTVLNVNETPVVTAGPAVAPASPAPGQSANFSVSATDPDGDTLSYTWNFGDSGSASGATASHAYASPGTYSVAVTISDGNGGSVAPGLSVTVANPNASPTLTAGPSVSPSAPVAGQSLSFSVSAMDTDGDPLSYAWTFGDGGTGTGASPVHTYAAAGSYSVAVTVSDGKGGTAQGGMSLNVTSRVGLAPTLASEPTAMPDPVQVGAAVAFTVSASDPNGDPLNYVWNFGDGVTATGPTVSHVFSTAGTYAATVTVSDGTYSVAGTVAVAVLDTAGTPDFTSGPAARPNPADVGVAVLFGATARDPEGGAVSLAWDFGDGESGSGGQVLHAYAAAGTYIALVTATDPAGDSTSSAVVVTVTEAGGGGTSNTLSLAKATITVNFTTTGADAVKVLGSVYVAADFVPEGMEVEVVVGGVTRSFTLDAKGRDYRDQNARLLLAGRGGGAAADAGATKLARLKLLLKNGAYRDLLEDYGLVNDEQAGEEIELPLVVATPGSLYLKVLSGTYQAQKDKKGRFTAP